MRLDTNGGFKKTGTGAFHIMDAHVHTRRTLAENTRTVLSMDARPGRARCSDVHAARPAVQPNRLWALVDFASYSPAVYALAVYKTPSLTETYVKILLFQLFVK